MEFSEHLKYYRKQKGLTQLALAEKLHVHQSDCCKWESGKCYPKVSVLMKICEVLEVTPNQMLGYEPEDIEAKFDRIADGLDDLCETIAYTKRKVFGNDR